MCIFVHNIPLVVMLFYHRTLIVLVLKDAYIYIFTNLSGKEGRLEYIYQFFKNLKIIEFKYFNYSIILLYIYNQI